MVAHVKVIDRQISSHRKKFVEKNKKRRWIGHLVPGWAGGNVSPNSLPGLRVRVYRPKGSFRFWMWIVILSATGATAYEFNTSRLESLLLSVYSGRLTYRITAGPSSSIVFPKRGPFDVRRGYTRITEFEDRLAGQGFAVTEQAAFSRDLARLARWGIAPPYRTPDDVGLSIRSVDGKLLFDETAGDRFFKSYQDIPPILVQCLLYMENRELGEVSHGVEDNPVVDWPRLAKAGATYAGRKIGLTVRLQGGSTLATQIEKYQHSPSGETSSGAEKLRQMLAASLTVYRQGRDTRIARQEIIVDYLNTVPLAAVPGYGEVNGLGNGLYAWFGLELKDLCSDLSVTGPPQMQARALRYALTLLAAIRAPDYYLNGHRDQLESRARYCSVMLTSAGIIPSKLASDLKDVTVRFSPHPRMQWGSTAPPEKAAQNARVHLGDLLGVRNPYELDRIHLEADTTIHAGLQKEVLKVLNLLKDKNYAAANGLYGDHLFAPGDQLGKVIYSFILYESTPGGNALRAEVDNVNAPFDINEGVKLQLGSTAKLRVLAHYLELMVALHGEYSALDRDALKAKIQRARDPLTRWAAQTLHDSPRMRLDVLLAKSLDRTYSANPDETFFTGGGVHNFQNFEREDNSRILSIREAAQRSVNLVFIRLMRDIVHYHEARLPYDTDKVLNNPDDPDRHALLEQIAADEARQRLAQYHQRYRGLTPPEALSVLLGSHSRDDRRLAIVFFAWHPNSHVGDTVTRLNQWLVAGNAVQTPHQAEKLVEAYGNPRLTISDYGYLLGKHPLEVWVAGQMASDPSMSWAELVGRSAAACKITSAWLFQKRSREAQDLRLRIRCEQDAFNSMTPYWQRLGFPFDNLVPSLATAIGSSSDRPAALAKLMGIIENDGILRSSLRFERLRFAAGTPYETGFTGTPAKSERVMAEPEARLLRQVLAEVVTKGTGIRDAKAFAWPDGTPIVLGGKTGSGDNRFVEEGPGGVKLATRAVNRTATFVFYLGDHYFGALTAFVDGQDAGSYKFTSALPLAILKILAPAIESHLSQANSRELLAGWNGNKVRNALGRNLLLGLGTCFHSGLILDVDVDRRYLLGALIR